MEKKKIIEAPLLNKYGTSELAKVIPIVFMVTVLSLGIVLTFLNPGFLHPPETSLEPLLTGDWTTEYQNKYESQMPIRSFARNTWGFIRYSLFQEGENGILIGSEHWLFTSEEFTVYPDREKRRERRIEYIRHVDSILADRGIDLAAAIVPAKARIYPEKLGRYRIPEEIRGRYDRFLQDVRGYNIPTPDLSAALKGAKKTGNVFLRTDTHWTPLGASAAALELSDVVNPMLNAASVSRGDYVRKETEEIKHRGDLFNFLPIGAVHNRIGPPPDTVTKTETVKKEGPAQNLFGTIQAPVVLVGTSYSAGEIWDFSGALEAELDVEVLNLSSEGEGPFIPMKDFLEELESRDDLDPAVVIWEIPERYIADPDAEI